ncbi:hypothetical protein BD626DRAFT_504905 [Schizophyllum amplum]|uniref:Uncharacterized protein n=1 Tax=Schizophyllum amplum TaxID=97359 RepID=A0A550C679_9AGAR|nr:hypothetical protein BD626DRAFT_504905 [Auriculariopsis ampla]
MPAWTRRIQTAARAAQTTVAKGTAFEERSLAVAREQLSMSLRRVGGRSDGGVDLTGWWWLPHATDISHVHSTPRRRLHGPNYVREMEGVLYQYHGAPPHNVLSSRSNHPPSDADDVHGAGRVIEPALVALFISESPFTKSTLLRAMSSTVPFLLLHLPPISRPTPFVDAADYREATNASSVGSVVMNHTLSQMLGGDMEVRWEMSLNGGGQGADGSWTPAGRAGLYWRGHKLESWIPEMDVRE